MELIHIMLGDVIMVDAAILWLNLGLVTSLSIYHRVLLCQNCSQIIQTSPIIRKQIPVQLTSLRTRKLRASVMSLLLIYLLVRLSVISMIDRGYCMHPAWTLSGYQCQQSALHKRIVLRSHHFSKFSSSNFYNCPPNIIFSTSETRLKFVSHSLSQVGFNYHTILSMNTNIIQ